MEGYYDVFRVLSLVLVWSIPTLLIGAVVTFAIGAPVLTLGGLLVRLYNTVWTRLPRKVKAKALRPKLACSVDADCPHGFVCVDGGCVPEKTG